MELVLYKNASDDNVINKELTEMDRINFNFKDRNNIYNPVLRLKLNSIPDSNYCEIPELNRKYFIRGIEIETNDLFNLQLECDLIETYKDEILDSVGTINREIKEGDYQYITLDRDSRKLIMKYESDVTVKRENLNILSTVSGVE